MPSIAPTGAVEALVEAVGYELTDIGGRYFTFLRAQLLPTDSVITVDSTYRFPEQGIVRVGQELIVYAAKTATTLIAVARAPNAVTYQTGKPVYEASQTVSFQDSARMQMVLATATGQYLRAWLGNFDLPVPNGFSEPQLRAYGRTCAYPVAGVRGTIAYVLGQVLTGQMHGARVLGGQLVLTDSTTWPAFAGRLVRILAPAKTAGLYRLGSLIDSVTAVLDPAAGAFYDSADGIADEAAVAVELVPWDFWEHPSEPCTFRIDVLKFGASAGVKGAAYLQGGELATSTADASHVTVLFTPNQVLAVWLATDTLRSGTNYYTGGSFTGKVLTLGTALPGAYTPVIVDYGSISYTAQALPGVATDGTTYFPFYLSAPDAGIATVLDVIRAAGYLPKISMVTV